MNFFKEVIIGTAKIKALSFYLKNGEISNFAQTVIGVPPGDP
jgi:hypothetical protein